MSTAEVVASLSGLAALGASPSSANAAALLSDTAVRMDKGELDDLTMLGQVTAAVAGGRGRAVNCSALSAQHLHQ